jgi:DNA recombination protein RmuC
MEQVLLTIGERAVTMGEAMLALAAVATLALVGLTVAALRGGRARLEEAAMLAERSRELDDKLAAIERLQAEMKGGVEVGLQNLDNRQSALARFVSERVEGLQHRVGQGFAESAERTGENLTKLNERLAVIDAAQRNLRDLTGEIVGLKDILANKQARGAYGQGRMEAIIRDGLPANAYTFQPTLKNNKRPDCVVHLPGDHPLVIDAKFPLEGFVAFREAGGEEARKAAAGRVKTDIGQHVRDMAERYLVPGETQDMALLFVPSEALYADLHEHFADVVERAHRQRIIVVSPSLLALAIQLVKSLVRDARMREEAQKIQVEVRRLLEDIGRLRDRVGKLDNHFRQAQEDVAAIGTSSEKIAKRGDRIEALEFDEPPPRSLSLVRRAAAE